MNKFLKKVAATLLGFAMAAGGAVAISAGRKDASPVHATDVLSWSRSGSSNTYTTGYTFNATASAKTGYYQDGSGTSGLTLYKANAAICSSTPSSVTFTANVGGGTGNKDLANSVYVAYVNSSGTKIDGSETEVTSHITTNTGDSYTISMPTSSATSAYGVYIYHTKESGYNVRYYSFSLSYESGGSGDQIAVTGVTLSTIDSSSYTNKTKGDNIDLSSVATVTYKSGTGYTDGDGSVNWTVTSGASYATISGSTLSLVDNGSVTIRATATNEPYTGSTNYAEQSFTISGLKGTSDYPYSISEAKDAVDSNVALSKTGVYVSGIVSQAGTLQNNKYLTYWLSSDGSTNEFEVYKGLNINGANFTSDADIQVGDEVVVKGNITLYSNTTYEFSQDNQLVSLSRPVSSTYTVSYNANGGANAPTGDSGIDASDALAYELADIGSLSRDGYEADGWATAADGAKVYDFGEEVDLTSISTNNALTLFAHWVKVVNPNKIVFADEGLTNGAQYNTFGTASDSDGSDRSSLNFTVEFSGGGNDGKYYDTGTGIRTYGGGSITITAKNNKKLSSITFVWSGNYKPSSDYTVDEGEYSTSDSTWTGLSNSVTLTKSGSDNWRLQSIEIQIGTTLVTGIVVSPSSLSISSDDTTAHTINITVSPNDADNSAVTISSNNTNVATVTESSLSGSGTFTIIGKEATSGTQVITVAATDASGISATLTLTAVDASVPILTGITVDQSGLVNKTQYVGNAFDPTGLTFTPVYNKTNPNPDTITASDFTWSTLVAGQDVTGIYNNDNSIVVTIDTVTVKNDVLEVTITGDELTNPNFLTSDSWNHNGITASASYESGASYSGSIEWSYSPETPAAMGVDDAGVLTITATAGSVSDSVDVLVTVSKAREVLTARTDTLDRDFTGIPDQTGKTASYSNWSDKTGTSSGVKYAGNSAGDKNSIQLRSNNSNSGIITTTSVGYIKSITVTFNTNTPDDRTIQVYGKNTAYSAPTELYSTSSSTKGTQLGTAVLDSSDTYTYTINVQGDYLYVGIRSASGAIYLDQVQFTFDYIHSAADVTAVDSFISTYMHLDYDNGAGIGSTGGDGSCVGYYGKDTTTGAKYNFSQLTDTQKEIILKSTSVYGTVGNHEYTYDEVRDRLSEWARINGETLNPNTGAFSSSRLVSLFASESTNTVAIIVIISMVSVTAIGGYFFLRKRKENI